MQKWEWSIHEYALKQHHFYFFLLFSLTEHFEHVKLCAKSDLICNLLSFYFYFHVSNEMCVWVCIRILWHHTWYICYIRIYTVHKNSCHDFLLNSSLKVNLAYQGNGAYPKRSPLLSKQNPLQFLIDPKQIYWLSRVIDHHWTDKKGRTLNYALFRLIEKGKCRDSKMERGIPYFWNPIRKAKFDSQPSLNFWEWIIADFKVNSFGQLVELVDWFFLLSYHDISEDMDLF